MHSLTVGPNGPIDLLRGTSPLAGPCVGEVDGVRHATGHVVLATGAEPIIPPIRGLRELDGVWTSREATGMKAVPRRLLVLGGPTIDDAAGRRAAYPQPGSSLSMPPSEVSGLAHKR